MFYFAQNYADMTWDNTFYFYETDEMSPAIQGALTQRFSSGDNVGAILQNREPSFTSNTGPFDCQRMTLGALYNDGVALKIVGLRNGQLVAVHYVTVGTTPQVVHFPDTFDDVDQVIFTGGGGTPTPNYTPGPQYNLSTYYVDDIILR